MCRFALYMGPSITLDMLITRPDYSIVRQSFQSRMRVEPLNGDGFGVAWYVPEISPEPAAFRSIQPAWNDRNLRDLARVSRSPTILAHVRAATAGLGVSLANCHPFTAGPLSLMHNGVVPDFLSLKRRFQQKLSDEAFLTIRGTTDSEHVFALFQDRHRDALQRSAATTAVQRSAADILADALYAAIAEVVELVRNSGSTKNITLNLVASDGIASVATRYASGDHEGLTLFISTGRQYVCDESRCYMVPADDAHQAVIVASEPLTDETAWKSIDRNQMVLIHPDLSVTYRSLE